MEGKNNLKLDCGNSCTTLNIPKNTELYTLNWWIAWYIKDISIKLFQKKKEREREEAHEMISKIYCLVKIQGTE